VSYLDQNNLALQLPI